MALKERTEADSLYSIAVATNQGETTTLHASRGQVLLIVNVASRCGFTPQYKDLETLYRDYHDQGFSVLGFPCDQFRHQEPGSNEEIEHFAKSCFKISFPLFAKIAVKGKLQAPLYRYLAKHLQKKVWIFIPWNFTKILVDAEGRVLKRYLPITPFTKIRADIQALLNINAM